MKEIYVGKVNAIRYADAVQDFNPIHRGDEAARGHGLDSAIAPGMWLASHVQGRQGITGIKQIKFSGQVPYGANISISENQGRRGTSDFEFKNGNEVVCSVNGVRTGEYASPAKELNAILHTYEADVSSGRTGLFLESLGFQYDAGEVPEMFLLSLSAPALLDFGAKSGLVGVHASQSFDLHESYRPGIIQIDIGNKKVRASGGSELHMYDLRWRQGDKVIASGRSTVGVLNSDLEERTE